MQNKKKSATSSNNRNFPCVHEQNVRAVEFFTGVKASMGVQHGREDQSPQSAWSCCLQVVISMGVPNFRLFSPLRMRAALDNFWWTWVPTWRTCYQKKSSLFGSGKTKSEFPTGISFCEYGSVCPPPKGRFFFESSPCWLPGPPKIIQIGPHPERSVCIRAS